MTQDLEYLSIIRGLLIVLYPLAFILFIIFFIFQVKKMLIWELNLKILFFYNSNFLNFPNYQENSLNFVLN